MCKEMGFQNDNFSGREMGGIVGQKSRVIRNTVCLSGFTTVIETLFVKRARLKFPKYIRLLVFVLAMIAGYSAVGQTPGLILKPATGAGAALLDPDHDGYVSRKTGGVQLGFQNNDVIESEIPFVAIVKPDPLKDILRGPEGGFTEIVGTDAAGNNAILTYTDGINLYFRFRLGGYAPNSKSYSILVDTDQKFGFTGPDADPDAKTGNPGFEVEIVLRTNFYVEVYDIGGLTTGVLKGSYSYDTNCQKSMALSRAGEPADADYFYDFYVPYPSLFSSSTALRYVATTGMSPSPSIGSNSASDVGGVTSKDVSLDQAFTELINVQTPTVPGVEVLDRTNCPTINGPISSGATSVTGASGDNGATIRLYVNDVQVGSTTVSGGNWTISGLTPLVGGASLKATAQAAAKGESSSLCNLTFVGSSCSMTPIVAAIENGDKGGRVTNVSSYPAGTVFTLYNASSNTEFSDTRDNNPYTITNADITRGTIDIGCGGTGNCLNDGSYYIVAQAPGLCTSQKSYFCVGSAISASSVPVIDNTIPPLSSFVTGTNGVAGAVMYIYANGTQIGSKTLLTGGSWSVPVPNTLICNTTLTARQIASSQCISATSAAVTIGSAVTSAPTISIDKCTSSITSVSGYSGESDGTIIQLFVNGVQRTGTALVSGGKWTFSTTNITVGQTITARANNSNACKTISDYSLPVTLSGTTSFTGAYSIPSTVVEGASSVAVVVTGVTGTYTLNLYIDQVKIGSQSFTGSSTVNVPVTYTSDIYTGGKLQVSLTQGTQCESTLSGILKTVECDTPSFNNVVISTPLSDKCITTSGTIDLTNSQKGVVYTPVDAAGVVKGNSTLGTGSTISLTTYAFPISGPATFYVRAQRIVPSGTCEARSSASVSFNAFAAPQFQSHPASKIVCSGDGTSLSTSWTGIGPFNVQWQYNNGSGFINLVNGGIYSQATVTGTTATSSTLNISNVFGLDNYTFRCIVTDTSVPTDCRSSTSNTSTLSVPLVTISNALVTNATLGNNGSIDITVSGGNAPYLYDWHHLNGSGTFGEMEDLTGMTEGIYTVTVKDANGCTYVQSFTVGGMSSINLTLSSQTNVSCYGENDGSFTVSASTGTAPYTYSIDNFVHSQPIGTFSGLSPGSYNVKARDASLKPSNTVLVSITEPYEIVVSAVISNPSVLLNDGTIYLTIDGGTPNFSYSLYKVGTPNLLIYSDTNVGSTKTYSNLSAGTYLVNVTDANGCTASKSNIVLTTPTVQSVQCSHTASHSFNGTTDNYAGFDGNYNYFSSDWIESPLRSEIEINTNALAFGCIPASGNTYSWNTPSRIYRQIDLQGASSIVLSYTVQAFGATNQNNYTVQMYVNDVLQATYNMANSYLYSNQSTETFNNIPFNTLNGNSSNKIEFRISSGNARANLRIDDITLSFKKSLTVGVGAISSTCNNGKVGLSVVGGYPPYLYDWDNDGTGDYNDAKDLTGLSPGIYKVTVMDSRNCTTTPITATVGSAPIAASITGSTNPTCVGGGSNGAVTAELSAAGGGGPYTYQLYKGASELVASVYSASVTKTFTGLSAGTYYVKVTQAADNCSTQTGTVTLTLPVFSSTVSAVGSTTICSGNSTTIKVDIAGGTSPYTVLLSNGQNVTNYTSGTNITVTPSISTTYTVVSITDASSCVSSSNTGAAGITVNPSLPVSVGISASPSNEICSLIPVTFTATPTNGGAGPVYQWKRNGVEVGTNNATFTYTPANGDIITCELTSNAVCVTGNPAISNSITMSVNLSVEGSIVGGNSPICLGAETGTMTLSGYTGNILRWERQINSGGWENIYNEGNSSFNETPWSSGIWEYRAVVQSGVCNAYSAIKSISIDPVTVAGWISGSSTAVCEGASTGTMILNGSTGSVVRWEKRLGSGSWTNINNTGLILSEIPSSGGNWEYRALVQSGGCSSAYSNSFSVNVNPTLTITLGANPSVCRGTTTALIPYTATTGNPAGFSIDFDTSANNAGLLDIPGWALPAGTIPVNVPWNINVGIYHGNLTVFTYFPVCSSISYPITIGVTYFSDLSGFNISATDACQESASIITVGASSILDGTYTVNYTLTGANVQAASNTTLVVSGGNSGTFTTTALANSGPTTITVNSISSEECTVIPSSGNSKSFIVNDNMPVSAFSYTGSPYCQNAVNPLPEFEAGGYAGTFSSNEGLIFVSTATGQIDLMASTPGTYTITNVIDQECGSSTSSAQVTILPGGSWTGAEDQDWNNQWNWICNQIPTLETDVLIANGKPHYPILTSEVTGMAHHIAIESNASVTVTGGTLQIAGNISNSGTFISTEGTIEMKGSAAQTIEANVFDTNTLMNLIVNNTEGLTLQGELNITGVVSPVSGTFNAGGHLTLISTAGQTALIDGSGTGNVTGYVNIQRYLSSSFGYKYFSSPFQSATVAELTQEVNLTETFPTFYKYDEDHSRDSLNHTVYYSGWTNYTEPTNALVPLYGYAANLGTDATPITVKMSGVVNNGALNTTLFNNNRKYTKGFNLVGNPYPSPIDWNAPGWTKTNIDNAIYFFNAGNTDRYGGVYSSFVNGVASGNANNVIAAMQGFFIHVSDGSYPVTANLGVTNSVRINNLQPVFKSAIIDPRPTFRLKAGFEIKDALEDAAVIYFDPMAGNGFEQDKDALKLNNTDFQVPNIYTLSPDGRELSINGLPVASDSLSFLPVGITTFMPGWINLRAENVNALSFFEQVILKDALTGQLHDLRRSPDVRFYLDKGKYDRRFSLLFSKEPGKGGNTVVEKLFTVIRAANSVLVKVNLPSDTKGNLMVTNLLGQTLLRKEVFERETVEINQGTGVYVITLVSGKMTVSEKILMRTDYE